MSQINGKKLVEYFASQKQAMANGLYTPEMVSELDPTAVAKTLNTLVSRVNFNTEYEARLKARRIAGYLILFGVVAGFVGASAIFWVLANPLKDLAAAIRESTHRTP